LIKPFIMINEKRRTAPIAANVEIYRKQKRLFDGLSRRIRGLKGEDPFALRVSLL